MPKKTTTKKDPKPKAKPKAKAKPLYLYLVETDEYGYDDYDSFIVAETSRYAAKRTCPAGYSTRGKTATWSNADKAFVGPDGTLAGGWVTDLKQVRVHKVGVAAPSLKKGEIVLASFNAG